MRNAILETVQVTCPDCRAVQERALWLAFDALERRDLRERFSDPRASLVDCPACGCLFQRPVPLLVVRLDAVAPVLVGAPDADLVTERPSPAATAFVARMEGEYGQVAPGPVLWLPLEVLALALCRDVAADLRDEAEAAAAAGGGDRRREGMYRVFLREVAATLPRRRIDYGLQALMAATDVKDVRAVLDGYPELRTGAAIAELEARLAQAADEEERSVRAGQLALLGDLQVGDLERAWGAHERRAHEFLATTIMPKVEALRAALEDAASRDAVDDVVREAVRRTVCEAVVTG